jgi:uncharacterized protein HemX
MHARTQIFLQILLLLHALFLAIGFFCFLQTKNNKIKVCKQQMTEQTEPQIKCQLQARALCLSLLLTDTLERTMTLSFFKLISSMMLDKIYQNMWST